jgi:aspartate aminotransferase
MDPQISTHFKERKPSDVRMAQIHFSRRKDDVEEVNVSIGNVSLPMHPSMITRMKELGSEKSPFKDGIVMYTTTKGTDEANNAFLHMISYVGCDTSTLHSQITDGGSQAMELCILGTCGTVDQEERPLMLIDAAYTNYRAFAKRLDIETVSVQRTLDKEGNFSLPDIEQIEKVISINRPNAIVIIPYDNPTGQFYTQEKINMIAELCVKYDIWLISDEAYRGLFYTDGEISSVWKVSEENVPGIKGRRISIESASKIWNACGIRIGAIVTDNTEFHNKAVAENTANLGASAIGQYIFGGLANLNKEDIDKWYEQQRNYYKPMMVSLKEKLKHTLPKAIVSSPDAALYSVIDLKHAVRQGFDAREFVFYCAERGSVDIEGKKYTLLAAPMEGFYHTEYREDNPGLTQIRISFVEPPNRMDLVPHLLKELLHKYENERESEKR